MCSSMDLKNLSKWSGKTFHLESTHGGESKENDNII